MYNQLYINSIGEKEFNRIINNDNYNINSNNFENKRKNLAFQHYLIKCVLNNTNNSTCNKYLADFYNDFITKPWEYVNSPLLNKKVINLIFGNNNTSKKIYKIRNEYYNEEKFKKLYNKKSKQELTENEKNQYYSNLIHILNSNNKDIKEIIEKEIKTIIDSDKNISEFNNMELQFYSQYVSNYASDKKIKTIVMIGEKEGTLRGNENNNLILINKKSIPNIAILTKTICHETRHSIQKHESKNKDSKAAFEMAQMQLFSKYLSTSTYDFYHENYRYSSIEIDAEKNGHFKASVFFTMFNKKDLADKVRENRKEKLDKRNYYSIIIDENKKSLSMDEFIVNNMDKIIKNNKEELDNYPVLKNIYNNNGNKKNFSEIIWKRINQNIDNRGIYDNYINYGIMNDQLNTLNIDKANNEEKNKLFKTLGTIYRDNFFELNNHLKDNPKLNISNKNNLEEKKNQIIYTTNYKIKMATKILTYINNNFEKMISSTDELLSNTSYIYDFIYDLRDFNLDSIKNPYLKNNNKILSSLKELATTYNQTLKKYNYYLTIQKINNLSTTERNSIINISGKNLTLEEYLLKEALPNMNSHQEITINNQKIYIGDFIYHYNKQTNNPGNKKR